MFAKAPASRSHSTSTMNGEVVKSEGVKFIRDVADLVLKSGILAGEVEEDSKVVNFEHPADLQVMKLFELPQVFSLSDVPLARFELM